MTWIKICGTTNLEDALISAEAGADALGFVFWERSPRNIDVQTVRKIVRELPGKIEKVGVFVQEPVERVRQIIEETGLTAAQLHYVNRQDEKWSVGNFKKYFVLQAEEPAETVFLQQKPAAWVNALFLDSGSRAKPGGTGKIFDWKKYKPLMGNMHSNGFKLVVAGGLTRDNVGEAIRILEPWGVDVVSGVEASPGKKDPAKVRAFVQAVREANR